MDTNKVRDSVREQFEKFALSPEGGLFAGHLAKGEDGEYLNYAAQCYWLFWQASREAVAVVLPGEEPGYMYYAPDVLAAIEAQGLKVTP
ncbi:hypothetical protein [Pseudomonas sp. DE0157]|uniref:hypothetical protein n=1 Tax=Pseudomonas sp. DE0157 TaxID=2584952 RepID=UPI0011A8E522|nr:hypothetical protein [Pseudomonas sp. DE0157]